MQNILFVYLSTATIVVAEDKTTVIKVGVYQLAPLVYFDDNGSSQGVFVDIIEEIAREKGWKVEYVKGTWNDGLERVKKGQIDLMTTVMHLSRRESFLDFPEESVFNIWGQIYIHKDTNILGVFDMEGKTIGVLKLVFDSRRYTKMGKPHQSRDIAIHPKWCSAYKIRGFI